MKIWGMPVYKNVNTVTKKMKLENPFPCDFLKPTKHVYKIKFYENVNLTHIAQETMEITNGISMYWFL
jgi:hypothetical protein